MIGSGGVEREAGEGALSLSADVKIAAERSSASGEAQRAPGGKSTCSASERRPPSEEWTLCRRRHARPPIPLPSTTQHPPFNTSFSGPGPSVFFSPSLRHVFRGGRADAGGSKAAKLWGATLSLCLRPSAPDPPVPEHKTDEPAGQACATTLIRFPEHRVSPKPNNHPALDKAAAEPRLEPEVTT